MQGDESGARRRGASDRTWSGRHDETPTDVVAWRSSSTTSTESYVSALMSVLEDVHHARRELTSEYQKLETTVHALPEGIILLDRDGEVLVCNEAADVIFGQSGQTLTREALFATPWLSLREILGVVHERREPYVADIEIREHPLLVLHVTATPLGGEQHGASVLITITNVTLQREADRMKDEFLTTVSHELRTPLAFIKLFLSNLFSGAMGSCEEKLIGAARRADVAVDNLTSLIDELFEYTRLTKGRQAPELEEISLAEIVEEVREVYEPIMRERGRRFTVEGHLDHPRLRISASDVRRVLTNLLDNAIRYTEQGGAIALSVADGQDEAVVRVQDDGAGIPKEYHALIFERFRQVGRSYGPGPKGLGLGLAICKEILDRHGGRIWVESEPGKGSLFSFSLPHRPSPAKGSA